MTDTTCPSCDAPAPAGARRCSGCGYRFVEDGPGLRERPSLKPVAFGGSALAALAVGVVLAASAVSTGDNDNSARSGAPQRHLDVLAEHPLGGRAAERLLAQLYIGPRDAGSASVDCTRRVAKPAHSVRRCIVRDAGGRERRVVLITTANGAEVISNP